MNRILAISVAASLTAMSAAAQTAPLSGQSNDVGTIAQPTYQSGAADTAGAIEAAGAAETPGLTNGANGTDACGPGTSGQDYGSNAANSQDTPDFSWIEEVTCAGGRLPDGQSAITAKVQTLLDRANVSPGVIDGWWGRMTQSALRAFEQRNGLPVDGEMDEQIWQALADVRDRPVTQQYTITSEDTQVTGPIPTDYSEKAQYERLGFERVTEALAEKFHMDEDFLRTLNPGAGFSAGETITVMAPGEPTEIRQPGANSDAEATVSNIRVDKSANRLYAMNGSGHVVASYPVTIGSTSDPSPTGTHEVLAIAYDPVYYYDPETFVQGDNYQKLELPPGPNNPVGVVWIDLSKDGYGIHGTPAPEKLFTLESHGCVRMTNWDALELASMVGEGTVVEFVQ